MRRVLASESMTIAGGTSPVQKNMIGERILQLPKG
jgi:alkylation response protein AidB-like acyl-CoA dehydrogenase